MLKYREMSINEAEKISDIDATNFIEKVWRMNAETQKYELITINWTDLELPNGFEWHLNRFKETLNNGGKAFGCFDENILVGYATIERKIFGKQEKYVLLDQLFVSKNYRNKQIGTKLFYLCVKQAISLNAEKIYLCAGSSENTIAFYKKLGCKQATEINEELLAEDSRDIQLEFALK